MFGNYQMPKKEVTSLHLHFTSNALAYGVYDPKENLYTYFYTHKNLESQVEWDSAFSNDPHLRMHYTECKASFTNNLFTLIPNALYEPREFENYIHFNINEADLYYKASKPVIELDAEVLFCVDRDSKIILSKYYPNSQIFHSSIPLLEGLLRQSEKENQDRLYIFTWNNHDMEMVAIQKGKLVFYNHFFLSSAEEFLYYPLYTCEQLGLDRTRLEVLLGGTQTPSSREAEVLKPYFRNFSFLGLPPGYKYAPSVSVQDGNGLIGSLAYLNLCE
jgi:hypothetical protein